MSVLEKLIEMHKRVVPQKNRSFVRYLYDKINWDSNAICVYGARGTGKTTLLIQDLLKRYKSVENALYFSADNVFVISTGLFEVADQYFKIGGKALYIDEIHKYPNWTLELKNIIDVYGDKQIIVSGSSPLGLEKGRGDLSRRVLYYELFGLSFREFLFLETDFRMESFKFDEILHDHGAVSRKITAEIPVLKHFSNYLKYGYYPFFLEGRDDFQMRLRNTVEKVLFEDIATVYQLKNVKLAVLKKMLWMIASSEPFIPNIDRMSRELGVSRDSVYNYLVYLEKSGMIRQVRKAGQGLKSVRKPEKIYMNNTGLIYAISDISGMDMLDGTLRETFFANQLSVIENISVPDKGDFHVNGKNFEVGGKNKKKHQLENNENSFFALDNIENGFKNTIPLYLFGYLY